MRYLSLAALLITCCVTPALSAQRSSVAHSSKIQTLLVSDSSEVGEYPTTSADGKWLVYSLKNPDGGSSLWLSPLPGGEPIRLTLAGFSDWGGVIERNNSRVFFISNRPTRNANDSRMYVMSVRLNHQRRPVGAVQQVTLDEVSDFSNTRSISPDGQWIVYLTPGRTSELKVVPSTGGNARTLATTTRGFDFASFSADGKSIVYLESNGTAKMTSTREIPFAGGSPKTVFEGGEWGSIPYPSDPGYNVKNRRDADRYHYQLVDHAGKLRDSVTLSLSTDGHFGLDRGDGRGFVGWKNGAQTGMRIMSMASGQMTTVGAWPPEATFVGLAASGQLIGLRGDSLHRTFVSISADGTNRHETTLPAGSWHSLAVLDGGRFAMAFGSENHDSTRALSVIDLKSGTARSISHSALRLYNFDHNGNASSFAERSGDSIVIQALAPDGAAHRVRSFSRAAYENLEGFAVHESRIAYGARSSKGDSVVLYIADRDSRLPRRIAAVAANATAGTSISFSPGGRKLAVRWQHNAPDAPVLIYTVTPNGSIATTPVSLAVPLNGELGNLLWSADERSVIVLSWHKTPLDEVGADVWMRPLDPGSPATSLLKPRPGVLAPTESVIGDGRSLYFTEGVARGGRIWTVVLTP